MACLFALYDQTIITSLLAAVIRPLQFSQSSVHRADVKLDRYLFFGIVCIVGAVVQFVAMIAARSEGAIDHKEGSTRLLFRISLFCFAGLLGLLGVWLFRHGMGVIEIE
jgi:H+/Cl- antiporter ClcA